MSKLNEDNGTTDTNDTPMVYAQVSTQDKPIFPKIYAKRFQNTLTINSTQS